MIISLIRLKNWREWRSIIMNNNVINKQLMREMFMTIRSAEIKNINTQKRDDKSMVKAIYEYISKRIEKEDIEDED